MSELMALTTRATHAAGRAALRRLLGRPRRAAWSARDEVLISVLRALTHFVLVEAPPSLGRSLFDITPIGRDAVRRERLGGVPGEWVEGPSAAARPSAALLYLHGGGYMTGSPRMVRGVTTAFARAGLPVFAPEYRLAPEHLYPAALDDAVAVFLALSERVEHVAVAGDSAGGGLALALAQRLRDEGGPMPVGVAAISPFADLRCAGASVEENAPFDTLSPEAIRLSAARYAGSTPLETPGLSPALGDFSGLPPLLVQCGGLELLRDDALAVAEAAEAAGVSVQLEVWPEQVHEFHLTALVNPDAQRALHHLIDATLAWIPS